MRHVASNVLNLLIVAGLALFVGVGYAQREFAAPGPLGDDMVVTIPQGASLDQISGLLAEAGAISDERLFRLGANYTGRARDIRYGEYRIPAGASMDTVIDLLVRGRTVQYRITIPEGLTSWEVVERLRADSLLTGEIGEVPPEGTLLPETYNYTRGDSRESILRRMEEGMEAALAAAWEARDPALPLDSPEDLAILASIVEKETAVPEERGRVASVFVNRLNRGWRLETDPTVIYGITEGKGPLGRGLRRSELRERTPYNTYIIEGLPPTPIANPGRASLMAAANPEETDLLFFVADGTGGHAFARTLEEHNRNVARWREIERARQSGE